MIRFVLTLCLAPAIAAQVDDPSNLRLHDARAVLANLGPDEPAPEAADANAGETKNLFALAAFARQFVQPALATGQQIKPLGEGSLAVLGTDAQQRWVEQCLQWNSRRGAYLIDVEGLIIECDDSSWKTVIAPVLARAESRPGSPAAVMLKAGAKTDAFSSSLEKTAGIEIVRVPRMLTHPVELSSQTSGKKIPYVKDFDVEVADQTMIADPVVDTVFHGIHVEGRAAFVGDDVLGVSIELTFSDVEQPIPTFTTTLGVGNEVTIQLPLVSLVRLREKLELVSGNTALLALPEAGDKHRALWLRASVVEPR